MTANTLTPREKKARSIALNARIVETIAQGFKRGAAEKIAHEFGVTKQYVSYLKGRHLDPDYTPVGKGRRHEVPFSERERLEFAVVLRGRPPVKGEPLRRAAILRKLNTANTPPPPSTPDKKTPLWTATQARSWFLRSFGRVAQMRQLSDFAAEIGVTLAQDDPAPHGTTKDWTKVYLTEEFRRWQATPQAAQLREREAALKLVLDERFKNTPLKRGRGRPKKFISGMSFDAPLSERSPRSTPPVPTRVRTSQIPDDESEAAAASRLYRNDPCPLDDSRTFGRCCGVGSKHHCLKTASAEETPDAEANK